MTAVDDEPRPGEQQSAGTNAHASYRGSDRPASEIGDDAVHADEDIEGAVESGHEHAPYSEETPSQDLPSPVDVRLQDLVKKRENARIKLAQQSWPDFFRGFAIEIAAVVLVVLAVAAVLWLFR